jgi:TnpA family transposase
VSPPAAANKRPDALRHIDALFCESRRNVTDWDLIERDFDDLMRVVLSVAAGKISPVTLLPAVDALPAQNFYMAFREAGRVTRTIQLPRYLSDPQLRRRTTAAANKVESYNNFSACCRFGNESRVRDNDPAKLEHQVKFSTLLANAVIFHTTLHMTDGLAAARRRGLGDQARGSGGAVAVPDHADQPVRSRWTAGRPDQG